MRESTSDQESLVRRVPRQGAWRLRTLLWPAELPQSPFEVASLNEFEQRLEAALALLPAMYREALLLVGVEDLRPVDAAPSVQYQPEIPRQRLS